MTESNRMMLNFFSDPQGREFIIYILNNITTDIDELVKDPYVLENFYQLKEK